MAIRSARSPLERLTNHYDERDLVCPSCQYEDTDGAWESETDGSVVNYRHTCPQCGAVHEHRVRLEKT